MHESFQQKVGPRGHHEREGWYEYLCRMCGTRTIPSTIRPTDVLGICQGCVCGFLGDLWGLPIFRMHDVLPPSNRRGGQIPEERLVNMGACVCSHDRVAVTIAGRPTVEYCVQSPTGRGPRCNVVVIWPGQASRTPHLPSGHLSFINTCFVCNYEHLRAQPRG